VFASVRISLFRPGRRTCTGASLKNVLAGHLLPEDQPLAKPEAFGLNAA
jgi:hypothetical protein